VLPALVQPLDQKVEKTSPSLGRQAIYSQHWRLTRLPAYFTIHMVRFAWRADIGKKTKAMVCPFSHHHASLQPATQLS
jgi:ubiquitin carboxyl-terminal hydrolase 14